MSAPLTAVVLAAGLGTRMRSPLAKVLHPLLGRPMVAWVVAALQELGADVIVVVNHQEDAVRAALPGVRFARQEAPLGTGHALWSALDLLPTAGPVIVTAGDTPLLTAPALAKVLRAHHGRATVASFDVQDPHGYGRIVRGPAGVCIVEQADCTPEQDAIREVNSGMYVFDTAYLRAELPQLQPHAPKGERYLTDLVRGDATVVPGFEASLFMGVNDRAALADARAALRRRVNRAWALQGVDFEDLDSTTIEHGVLLEPDAHVGIGTLLAGTSRVSGHVGPHCVITDSVIAGRVDAGCVVTSSTIEAGAVLHANSLCHGAAVHAGAEAGPLARLRPGATLLGGARIGNFVEVKNSVIGVGAKANHLAYLGDAEVGAGANVGAGTITCNYDGFAKHRTTIGKDSFIGSNSALVAPVSIGDGAIVGAGSTITVDVPPNAIAVTRTPQRNAEGMASRLRERYRAKKKGASS
jgi:bifunctional UDP-N-acetylglucosamine pyrophosphorylase/glucosamine-1-phosphate N-acetyltransferase